MSEPNFVPQEDWMLLEPVIKAPDAGLILPDIAEVHGSFEKRQEINSFKVTKMGPWASYPVLDIDVTILSKVGDEVIMEGLMAPQFMYENKPYYCGRARNVAFVVKGGEDART